MKPALAPVLALFLSLGTLAAQADPLPTHPMEVLQDPDAHLTYYVESDRCHVSAFDPTGKMVWRVEVLSFSDDSPERNRRAGIQGLSLKSGDPDNYILVVYSNGANTWATINKHNGLLRSSWDSM